MAPFQAKIGWKRPRKRENKKRKIVMMGFLPDREQKIPKKIAKKFKNVENTIIASFQAKISWESPRNGKNKKKIIPICSYPTRNRKSQKNSKKIQKIKKHHPGFILS